jgi:hypothetical protein
LFYCYNLNEDVAKREGFIKGNFKFEISCQKYLKYYSTEYKQINYMPTEDKPLTELVINKKEYITMLNLENPETYEGDFTEKIVKHYKFNDSEKKTLQAIVQSGKTPVTKGLMIRKLIRETASKSSDDMDKLLKEEFENFNSSQLPHDYEGIKIDFALSGKHKESLIKQSTSYKQEYEKLKCILGTITPNLILGNITLKPGVKKSLLSNISITLDRWKNKNKNKCAILRLMRESLNSCSEGDQTNEGFILDEVIRDHLVDLNEGWVESEEEDIYDPPVFGIKRWRIRKG